MKTASLPRRLGAMLYDTLLILALLLLGSFPFVALAGGEAIEAGALRIVYQLAIFAIIYGFFLVFWVRFGRTLGMESWKLRIETFDGRRPTARDASLRFLAALLSWLPAGLGYLWQLVDRDGLAWHDRLSRTRLVHDPDMHKSN